MRSSYLTMFMSALALTASAASAATAAQPSHYRPTATVAPNGTSCPSPNTQATVPPLGRPAIAPDTAHDNSPAAAPNIAANPTCPATGSDAETNIARGHALAKPEPLNSPTLIAPRR